MIFKSIKKLVKKVVPKEIRKPIEKIADAGKKILPRELRNPVGSLLGVNELYDTGPAGGGKTEEEQETETQRLERQQEAALQRELRITSAGLLEEREEELERIRQRRRGVGRRSLMTSQAGGIGYMSRGKEIKPRQTRSTPKPVAPVAKKTKLGNVATTKIGQSILDNPQLMATISRIRF